MGDWNVQDGELQRSLVVRTVHLVGISRKNKQTFPEQEAGVLKCAGKITLLFGA